MNIEEVVLKLAQLEYIRPNRIIGDYYSVYCPFHNDGNERKASFGILLHEQNRAGKIYSAGFAHCFTCGYAKNFLDFLADLLKTKSITQSTTNWLAENIPDFTLDAFDYLIPSEIMQSMEHKYASDYINLKVGKISTNYVQEEELAKYRYVVPYMYERKLNDAVIAKFDVGFDKDWVPPGKSAPVPCITFPVKDGAGNVLFICRRAISYKFYYYPKDTIKTVYGIDQITRDMGTVCICESCINALTLWAWGYPAVALLGTGNSIQIKQLKELGVRNFVLCMDGDEAGAKATAKLKHALSSVALLWTVAIPEGKDVNDLDKPEFDVLFAQRE